MLKQYMSRQDSKMALMAGIPSGDPYGGAAYGEFNDPVTAIAGGAIASGGLGYLGARESSKASKHATDATIEEQRRQFDLMREDTAPYREAGRNALREFYSGLDANMGRAPTYTPEANFKFDVNALQNLPGYKFQLEQGLNAAERVAAKQGNLRSGNALLEAQRIGQGMAQQAYGDEFNRQLALNQDRYNRGLQTYGINFNRYQDEYGRKSDRLNRLASLFGAGQSAVGQSGQAGTNMANMIGQSLQSNAANQIASKQMLYGGLNNAIQGGMSNYMFGKYAGII